MVLSIPPVSTASAAMLIPLSGSEEDVEGNNNNETAHLDTWTNVVVGNLENPPNSITFSLSNYGLAGTLPIYLATAIPHRTTTDPLPSSVYAFNPPPNDSATPADFQAYPPTPSLESTGPYASPDYLLSASLPDPPTGQPFNSFDGMGPFPSPSSESFVTYLFSSDLALMERELDGRGMRQFNERVLRGLDPVEDEEEDEDEEGGVAAAETSCLASIVIGGWKSLWEELVRVRGISL